LVLFPESVLATSVRVVYIFVVMFHHRAGFSILQMCLHEPCLLLVTTADPIAVMF